MRPLRSIAATLVFAVACSACLGSRSSSDANAFVVRYFPAIGNLSQVPARRLPTRAVDIRCGASNHLVCGALAYYTTHSAHELCVVNAWSTPATINVSTRLNGGRITTPVASPCHNASRLFKTAANVIYLAAATVRPPKAEVRRWLARTPQTAALTRQGAAL